MYIPKYGSSMSWRAGPASGVPRRSRPSSTTPHGSMTGALRATRDVNTLRRGEREPREHEHCYMQHVPRAQQLPRPSIAAAPSTADHAWRPAEAAPIAATAHSWDGDTRRCARPPFDGKAGVEQLHKVCKTFRWAVGAKSCLNARAATNKSMRALERQGPDQLPTHYGTCKRSRSGP